MDALERYLRSYLAVVIAAYLGVLWARSLYNEGVTVAYKTGHTIGLLEGLSFTHDAHDQGDAQPEA